MGLLWTSLFLPPNVPTLNTFFLSAFQYLSPWISLFPASRFSLLGLPGLSPLSYSSYFTPVTGVKSQNPSPHGVDIMNNFFPFILYHFISILHGIICVIEHVYF